MEFKHISVLLNECIDALQIKPDGTYIDGTLGGGGHSGEIAKRLNKNGTLVMFDLDTDALDFASNKLKNNECNMIFAHSNFKDFKAVLDKNNIDGVDGILLDLGVSSYQIDTPERGFSYMADGALNMAMDKDAELNAEVVVNEYAQEKLEQIFRDYGEEKFSKSIARAIVAKRKLERITTTQQLVNIISSAIPAKARFGAGHPAKRVFQAIRIEVNGELEGLRECVLSMAREGLKKGGRLAIITFHSLEDRIVKEAFNLLASDCICDKRLPICVCHHTAEVKLINKKPITSTNVELELNSRAHSAKLRVLEKL
ncbi:MAG: 16S rRNA (cytosine(1402)-N(4))-methyltransferase RsmH [Clostridia bacterium]|nr:16S rRNA (cytosine(1402)-N(4))-methyltransferase RsmH [Clostridia bacterium]